MAERRKTTTSNFGVGARESHDSKPFYDRFEAPDVSDDHDVPRPAPVEEPFVCGDARRMDRIADRMAVQTEARQIALASYVPPQPVPQ